LNNIVTSIGIKVIGGRTLSTTAILQNNYFASGPSLPYNIAEAASIEVNDNIYVIGGKGKEFSNTFRIDDVPLPTVQRCLQTVLAIPVKTILTIDLLLVFLFFMMVVTFGIIKELYRYTILDVFNLEAIMFWGKHILSDQNLGIR